MNTQNKQTDLEEQPSKKNEIDQLIKILATELEQDLDNLKYSQEDMIQLFFEETDHKTKEEWADNFLDYNEVIFPKQLEELESFEGTYLEEIAEEYMKEFWRLNYQDNKILENFLCDSFYAWYIEIIEVVDISVKDSLSQDSEIDKTVIISIDKDQKYISFEKMTDEFEQRAAESVDNPENLILHVHRLRDVEVSVYNDDPRTLAFGVNSETKDGECPRC